METPDAASDAPSSLASDDHIPMNGHSENNVGIGNELSQIAANGDPTAPESEPNNASVHKFFKGKENVGKALSERSGKLTLLELPVDILRLVVQEVINIIRTPYRRIMA